LIADAAGALYGATSQKTFKLTPPPPGGTTWTETILYNLGSNNLLMDSSGALYSTGYVGGTGCGGYGCGGVFKLAPPASGQNSWVRTVLYTFAGGNDGANPRVGLTADIAGALYGVTSGGDVASDHGTVFKLTPPLVGKTTWTETVLYRFKGGTDGAGPRGLLIVDTDGAIYSTTNYGGGSGCNGAGCGTVFKLTPPAAGQTAWKETVLYRFTGGNDGELPHAGLTLGKGGVLFGTTYSGGSAGFGTVFKVVQ
jgi:uncharacterized repeat protein (TIGR03803 family)